MADPVGTTSDVVRNAIPKITLFGGGFVNMFAWFILLLVTLIFFGVLFFILMRLIRFNKKIIIFEKIDGVFKATRKDRASEIKFSTGGDTITYCLRHKKYLPNPTIQTGSRTFWYFIRSDGEWINFGLDDLDQQAKKAGARFLAKEARFARTQIQKGLKERYDKPSFWEKHGIMIMNIIWIAMIGSMTFLLFDKWIDLAGVTNAGVETAGVVLEKTEQIMGSLDNICSGSGIR